jgi:SagB-type dehydrogenase family enzyme
MISPEVFFLVEDGQVLLWNCKTHEQYLIDQNYFAEILSCASSGLCDNNEITTDLKNAGVIVDSQPALQATWGWDILSRLFHIGTKNVPSIDIDKDNIAENYLAECDIIKNSVPAFFQEKDAPIVELPIPSMQLESKTLSEVLLNRKTSRSFNGQAISLQQLSDLLYSSFGLIHGQWQELAEQGLKIAGIRKSMPSSGGLHAEEAYLVVYQVEGLEPGLYYYRPQDHCLNLLQLGCFEETVIQFNKNQNYSKGMAFGIYITARLDKYWWKYEHSRTYRIMLLDMGHVSQTFLLSATALGLNTWVSGAFDDAKVESFLGINGYDESVMLYVGAGHGESAAFPQSFYVT